MTVKRETVKAGGIQFEVQVTTPGVEEFRRLLWRPGGAGNDYLKARAEAVAAKARRLAPKRTGALARSIRVRQSRETTGRFESGYEVISESPYALYVHEGTRPHVIKGRPLLVFDFAGRTPAFFRSVKHPGTKAQRFLADAVGEAVR